METKTQVKHTPGPWIDDINIYIENLYGETEMVWEIITKDKTQTIGYATTPSNARLMASAPELLEVMKTSEIIMKILANSNDFKQSALIVNNLAELTNAIAKAEARDK